MSLLKEIFNTSTTPLPAIPYGEQIQNKAICDWSIDLSYRIQWPEIGLLRHYGLLIQLIAEYCGHDALPTIIWIKSLDEETFGRASLFTLSTADENTREYTFKTLGFYCHLGTRAININFENGLSINTFVTNVFHADKQSRVAYIGHATWKWNTDLKQTEMTLRMHKLFYTKRLI